jgi:hypothetical protein
MAANKTVAAEDTEARQCYVTGLDCTPTGARRQMMATKARFDKGGGVVALHGYQSFAPGEATPDVAHEIGVKLAQRLWGGRFEVIVATHLDRGHIHNHVVVNTVSFVDGRKLRATVPLYRDMRRVSDELCREYGLSVIEGSQPGRAQHYAEWQAERGGRPTWASLIKTDVDAAIAQSMTTRQFFEALRRAGYEIKQGKDISVRPQGKERFFRLARNFGQGYSAEGITRRILSHEAPSRAPSKGRPPPAKAMPALLKGSILSLHRHYLYLLGRHRRQGPAHSTRTHFLLREDMRHLDELIADEGLLCREGIDSAGQLSAFADRLRAEAGALCAERASIRRRLRTEAKGKCSTKDNPRIKEINARLRHLRREVRQCTRIEERSKGLAERIGRIEQDEYREDRKEARHERNRTGGGQPDKDNAARD